MSFYVIIRGPLAVGKTTIAKNIAKTLRARYYGVDKVLEDAGLTKEPKEGGYISQKTFFKVNNMITAEAREYLERKIPVIFDGNFYWKSVIEDLVKQLNYPYYIFTLVASRDVCIKRDKARTSPHGEDAARVVYKKATSFRYGIEIDTSKKSADEVVEEILKRVK